MPGWVLKKPFDGLSGHGSSSKRRAKPENLSRLFLAGEKYACF